MNSIESKWCVILNPKTAISGNLKKKLSCNKKNMRNFDLRPEGFLYFIPTKNHII